MTLLPATVPDSPQRPLRFRHVRCRSTVTAGLCALALALLAPAPIHAQTMEDSIMLSRNTLCAGALYTHDSWDDYWEGALERANGNIGTVTTQMVNFTGNYGVTDRINLFAEIPYVWTDASKGVLRGQSGFQDVSLAAKVDFLRIPVRRFGTVNVIAVASGALPTTDYTPDLQPLSIGTHSKRFTSRGTVGLLGKKGLYLNATTAYTWRGNVQLDRNAYYTNGQLYLSNQVAMPNVFEYTTEAGYYHRDLMVTGMFSQQQMRGGGDIRRQDLPFVSNRMNFSKAGVRLQTPIPIRHLHSLQYWLSYTNTFEGRNVGQSNTITTGLMYRVHFERHARP